MVNVIKSAVCKSFATNASAHANTKIMIPENMVLKNNKLEWQTTTKDVGSHEVLISVTDGIETAEQPFLLNVNDIPTIISPDSIYIMVVLQAKVLQDKLSIQISGTILLSFPMVVAAHMKYI